MGGVIRVVGEGVREGWGWRGVSSTAARIAHTCTLLHPR